MGSGRSSTVSFVIASISIVLYIAAIAFGAIRIIVDIGERRSVAEQEFNDLADRSSSAAVLGFMSNAYQESIRDSLNESRTLLGVIISVANGEYAFERYPGSVVVWAGDSPRFKTGIGLPGEPFYRPLRIEGQRNGSIQGSYSYITYDLFIGTLRNTLVIIVIVLGASVLTLILGTIAKTPSPASRPQAQQETPVEAAPLPEDAPRGLFSPRSNIGWESYTLDRLASELHRCASFEQDLTFILMEFKDGKLDDPHYKIFAEEAAGFFTLRDLVFEKGERGIAVILPNIDLDQGLLRSEEFRERILKKLPDSAKTRPELCIGLSSRSGRLMEAERLLFETSQALLKALSDPLSPVVAFKSDPEKYRNFIRKTHSA
ncbi:MAG: hypothetical protein LBQ67_02885 [Treponema sp.]|jgi:hypothetical protein|nr:hypothetical protein [Treponema sp.]